MSFKKPTRQYWDNKLAAYMHDPFDKAFRIQGHENRAAEILRIFGLEMPNEKFWQKADGIASGFERGQVPTYNADPNKNGAVDLINDGQAIISHPTGSDCKIRINIENQDINKIHHELKNFLKDKIGDAPEKGGYSKHFPNDHDRFSVARFFYTHLALRFKLSEDDVAGLGAFWHRIPADTRFPDHSIWQHNALTSALYSSMELAGNEDNIGLLVFSITPVQAFISQARKLRDYWTGSVLLSWLAFEGLRWVMENLGPDHVLYPSLVDQPLVNEYLQKRWFMDDVRSFASVRDIASLPNKFVVLIPFNQSENIAEGITQQIKEEWLEVIKSLHTLAINEAKLRNPEEIAFLYQMMKGQAETYWEMQWSAARLLGEDDTEEFIKLLPEVAYKNQVSLVKILNKIIENKVNYQKSGKGTLYSVSHTLVQSALAAQKMQRINQRLPQTGIKCSLCGEFEALHSIEHKEGDTAYTYSEHVKTFWKTIAGEKEIEIRRNERLCTICYTKRMAYRLFKSQSNAEHILNSTFSNADQFPSTTEMSLFQWFERNAVKESEKRKELANRLHNDEEGSEVSRLSGKELLNADKYYAILVMDGDNMGKLINGSTIASTWESIMHPIIVERLQKPEFDANYRENWKKIFEIGKRAVTPSIHAAISEALGDFSIYGVEPIIRKFHGRLIYAGGDDVCAVLPVRHALNAATEIQNFYTSAFKLINNASISNIGETWEPEPGKLSVFLGRGEEISISAGILICHHKENLAEMIAEAQTLLKEKAKKESGRNALALQLKKRSGGSRFAVQKWNNGFWKAFKELSVQLGKTEDRELSRSLIYRLGKFNVGLMAILKSSDAINTLERFLLSQLDKSGIAKNMKSEIAGLITRVLMQSSTLGGNKEQPEINIDPLVIAAFLAGEDNYEMV